MWDESGHMWVITTDERHGIYNLAALLARTDTQEQANDIVQHIADRLTALDLRR